MMPAKTVERSTVFCFYSNTMSLRGPQSRGNPVDFRTYHRTIQKFYGIATPVCALARNDMFFLLHKETNHHVYR